jgi:hypothetical protein
VEVPSLGEARRGATSLPGRLRSALSARGWVQRPEPRVRFGQPVFVGVPQLGPAHADVAAPMIARARAVRDDKFVHLGRTVPLGAQHDWFPTGTSVAWQRALHGLDELVAIGVAGATAAAPDERFAWYSLARELARDWIRKVPAGRAVAWEVGPLARRVRNLLLLQGFFVTELRADAETRRELLLAAYDQAAALAAAVGRHAPDPWLIAAGQALMLAGRFFDGLEARGWVETGSGLVWGQLREQVHEDGGHVSRSPVWHAFVLAEYLGVLALLRADNDDVPIWGRKRVKGMADSLARLAHPDGTLPEFGPSPADDTWPVPELLATAAVVLHEPAFAHTPELPGTWPLLLLGEAGRRTYAGLARRVETTAVMARALRRTGFYLLAGGTGDVMVVDGGSQPCTDGAATFGFELSVGGAPLVIGAHVTSEEEGPVAAHARRRSARNVLVATRPGLAPDGEIAGRFTIRDGVQYFLGTHRGFAGLGPDVEHRRRVFCLPGRFWLVTDELLGSGTFAGESLVHLHPDTVVRASCAGRPSLAVSRSSSAGVAILPAGVRSLSLVGGATEPEPQGWYATDGRCWTAAPVVVLRVAGALPLALGYAIVPHAEHGIGEVMLESDAFELRARVRLGDVVHELTAVQDEVGLVTRPA